LDTGAHLAVTEGSTYFPSGKRTELFNAIEARDSKTVAAIRSVSGACEWRFINKQSLERLDWALRHIDWVLRDEWKTAEANKAAEREVEAERNQLVEYCATLHGLCNAARQELGRTLVEFSRGELAERRTETLREQHRALLEQLRALNAAVAEQHKAEEPRKSKGKRRAPPPEPQRPQRTHAA
ncbi:MAG: hypothetical protein AAB879_02480, partial [Patescibacteria group bacterium]